MDQPRPFNAILPEEAQFHVLSFLAPKDMVSAALACRGLGVRRPVEERWNEDAGERVTPFVTWSVVEEAARLVLASTATDREKLQLPLVNGMNWLGRYEELLKLRAPLRFDMLYGEIVHTNDERTEVRARLVGPNIHAAVSAHVMRGGVHCASFKLTGDGVIGLGVVPGMRIADRAPRPRYSDLYRDVTGWNVGTVKMCTYQCDMGRATWSDGHGANAYNYFEGAERAVCGDVVCLRLSLRSGTLTLYKNGQRLGIIKSGLRGEYSWCAYLCTKPGWTRPSVRMIRGSSFPDEPDPN